MPLLSPVHTLHQAPRLYLYVKSVDMRRSILAGPETARGRVDASVAL